MRLMVLPESKEISLARKNPWHFATSAGNTSKRSQEMTDQLADKCYPFDYMPFPHPRPHPH